MEIQRAGSQPSTKRPSTGSRASMHRSPFSGPDAAFVQGASVTFEPGARTAWHTHPLGQTLIVTAGYGWAQREGGPVEEIRPGDVIWFSPARNTGTEPHRPRPWLTSPSRKRKMARLRIGWSRSAKSNTASKPAMLN